VLVVLDSNVLVAALRSRRGASFEVLRRLRDGRFTIAVSVVAPRFGIEVMTPADFLARLERQA
jgi:predicted nucleic acid-binding protein